MLRAWGASSFLKKAATFSPTPRASLKPGTLRWMNAMGSPSRMLPFSPRSPISMNENSAQPPTKRPSGDSRMKSSWTTRAAVQSGRAASTATRFFESSSTNAAARPSAPRTTRCDAAPWRSRCLASISSASRSAASTALSSFACVA